MRTDLVVLHPPAFDQHLRLQERVEELLAKNLPERIRCFGCDAVRPGVPPAEAEAARCPRCLALLYQEPDVARELARGAAEPDGAAAV